MVRKEVRIPGIDSDEPDFVIWTDADENYWYLTEEQLAPFNGELKWEHRPGKLGVQAPITFSSNDDYVVSHRRRLHVVSYRPPGQHHHVGNFETHDEAFAGAVNHLRTRKAP